LWRLALEGRIEASEWERRFYALALKVSGAVQARRWTTLPGGGYIYSFNGAHSLFVDTIRSLRALALSHVLGHRLVEEQDAQVNLLARLVQHAQATAQYNVFYARSSGPYDVCGRVAHESLFNVANGTYRGPSTQQGYSPFSTWTRGLAWAMLGFAEQLEFLSTLTADDAHSSGAASAEPALVAAARATCDFYIDSAACADGIPFWDTGAPGLSALGDWGSRASDPFNDREPVDSSAAAIGAQGLLRFGRLLTQRGEDGARYTQAGLRVLDTLFDEAGPYLSQDANHQGLLLHSVYHWPNGWDHVPAGARVPRGESSQWGDYHAREAALYVKRLAEGGTYLAFYGPGPGLRAQGSGKTSE
jgi:unsaturated chondroitin disaccharide hydrolase